jgi:uncharacterized protein
MAANHFDLATAARRKDASRVRQLLAEGLHPDARIHSGFMTALQWAASADAVEVIPLLLAAGADVDGTDRAGFTPLRFAAHDGRPAALTLLIDAGANVNATALDGNTALHRASANGHLAAIAVLLAAGARTDIANGDGQVAADVVRPESAAPKADVVAALLAGQPWGRRRPVAVSCYAVEWDE